MNNLHIHIQPTVFNEIKNHLEASFPYEGCGFLFGEEKGSRVITKMVPALNNKTGDQRRRFEISPLDYMKAERLALTEGLTLLGIYHSHPNHPAIPSEHDRIQAMPYFSYLILSIQEGNFAKATSWRLKEEEQVFEEEQLTIYTPQGLNK